MYGLSPTVFLANRILKECLNGFRYYPCQFMPRFWKHIWSKIMFPFVIDGFVIK